MVEITIKTEFIKLGQFLKLAHVIANGSDAKIFIEEGLVKVNGEVAFQRGKKLYDGFIVEVENEEYKVKVEEE